jgi:hypothetical protein
MINARSLVPQTPCVAWPLIHSRRTPTTPSLRRGRAQPYPSNSAVRARRSLRRRLLGAERPYLRRSCSSYDPIHSKALWIMNRDPSVKGCACAVRPEPPLIILLKIQLFGNPIPLDPLAQGGPGNSQQFCRFHLIPFGALHRKNGKLPFQPRQQLQPGIG